MANPTRSKKFDKQAVVAHKMKQQADRVVKEKEEAEKAGKEIFKKWNKLWAEVVEEFGYSVEPIIRYEPSGIFPVWVPLKASEEQKASAKQILGKKEEAEKPKIEVAPELGTKNIE